MQRTLRLTRLARTLSTSASTSASAGPSTSSSPYTRPLKAGVLPAYDEALKYLEQDRDAKLAQLDKTRAELSAEEAEKLEVDALVNDPEVRWRAANKSGDLSKPVYRHLAERAWRKEGPLAILMQRITQMSVTPDLLAEISPEANLEIKIAGNSIEPGSYALPSQTVDGIEVSGQVFHPEERLYTLLLVDPDVPDEANASFATLAHWLVPPTPPPPPPPPAPPEGTPYHRYTALLLEQPGPLALPAEGADGAIGREAFNVRAFVAEHGLAARGVSFFRQKWTKEERATISRVWAEVLKQDEPRFGRRKGVDMYKGLGPKYEVV